MNQAPLRLILIPIPDDGGNDIYDIDHDDDDDCELEKLNFCLSPGLLCEAKRRALPFETRDG